MRINSTYLKALVLTLFITLLVVCAVEIPGYLSMRELLRTDGTNLGTAWLTTHFSPDRLPRYFSFVALLFALIHILVLLYQHLFHLHKEGERTDPDDDE